MGTPNDENGLGKKILKNLPRPRLYPSHAFLCDSYSGPVNSNYEVLVN